MLKFQSVLLACIELVNQSRDVPDERAGSLRSKMQSFLTGAASKQYVVENINC